MPIGADITKDLVKAFIMEFMTFLRYRASKYYIGDGSGGELCCQPRQETPQGQYSPQTGQTETPPSSMFDTTWLNRDPPRLMFAATCPQTVLAKVRKPSLFMRRSKSRPHLDLAFLGRFQNRPHVDVGILGWSQNKPHLDFCVLG